MKNTKSKEGVALITLLVFTVVALTITTATVAIIVANTQGSMSFQEGIITKSASESGIENALMTLIRNPNYTGETITINNIQVEITISGTDVKTITSTAQTNHFKKTTQVIAGYTNNMLTVSSWKEL